MILNIIWNIDPDIFTLGPFQLKWLTVLLVAGILAGKMILSYIYKKDGGNLKEASQIFYITLVAAVIGSRLFYVAFMDHDILFNKPGQIFFPFDFDRGFRFTGLGQFSMLGMLAGVVIALFGYAKLKKRSVLALLDKGLFVLLILIIFMRVGELFQSEYIGTPTDAKTGVLFVHKVERGLQKLPCCAMRNPNGENPLDTVSVKPGKVLLHKAVGYRPLIAYVFFKDGATEQLVNEFLIGDVKSYLFEVPDLIYEPGTEPLHYTIFVEGVSDYMARIQTIGIARHPLQVYEAVAYLILFLILFRYWRNRKQIPEGKMAGILLMSVSGIHFAIEFLNVISRPLIKSIPLTTDQYLCLPIFILGVLLLFLSRTKKAPVIGQ